MTRLALFALLIAGIFLAAWLEHRLRTARARPRRKPVVERAPVKSRPSYIDECPTCGTRRIETMGEAHQGGGYHRQCENGHGWDDVRFSYGEAEAHRRSACAPTDPPEAQP